MVRRLGSRRQGRPHG